MLDKVFFILVAQGVGDHLFQGPRLSVKKRDSFAYLMAHTGLYSITLLPLSFFLLGFDTTTAAMYFGVNFILHALVDFGTGKLKKRYWKKNENAYFSVAAIDQLVHIALMILTYVYFATGSFNLQAVGS
jgi:hypothetical protein